MNSEEFLTSLKKIAPKVEGLIKLGLSEDFINEEMKSYDIRLKSATIKFYGNVIFDLVENYKLDNFYVGMIHFNNHIYSLNGYTYFGNVDIDILAVNNETEEVVMINCETNDQVFVCAQNGEKFLDALIVAKDYFNRCMLSEDVFNDNNLSNEISLKCSKAAGYDKTLDFYKFLLS